MCVISLVKAGTESVTEPVIEPATESVTKSVTESVTESVIESVTESVIEPVTESVIESVTDPSAETDPLPLPLPREAYQAMIRTFEEKMMPIYNYIYQLEDGNFTEENKNHLDNLFEMRDEKGNRIHDVSQFPYKHSAIHRAIQEMNVGAVNWLCENDVKLDYGMKQDPLTEAWSLQTDKERGKKPEHLIEHLKNYYHESYKDRAQQILTILQKKFPDIGTSAESLMASSLEL